MANDATPAMRKSDRIVIDYRSGRPGLCLVVIAGLHGDERGGIVALERVCDAINTAQPKLNGRFVGLLGNLAARDAGKRYIARDLNRDWNEDSIAALRAQDPATDSPEDTEQRELLDVLNALEHEANRPVIFLDLHSTSADGPAFSCMPDTLINLRYALELPFPAILGLEETINGPLLGMLSDHGYPGVIVEGGQHEDEFTADILESCVWVLMARLGCLQPTDIPAFETHHARLAAIGAGLPRVLEIYYRHETHSDDGFTMVPGFRHYDRVRKGQLIAHDNTGEIRALKTGRIIMPSYKPGTDQGFFIARDILWLYVRALFFIRHLKLGRLAHLLPGTHRYADNPNLMTVSNWVPNFFVNIIRLLGWRRMHRDEERTTLRRRRVRV